MRWIKIARLCRQLRRLQPEDFCLSPLLSVGLAGDATQRRQELVHRLDAVLSVGLDALHNEIRQAAIQIWPHSKDVAGLRCVMIERGQPAHLAARPWEVKSH